VPDSASRPEARSRRPARPRDLLLDQRIEIDALEVLHHEVRTARLQLPDVHHPNDVVAPKGGRRTRLVQETSNYCVLPAEGSPEKLDRDWLVELDMPSEPDDAHPSLGENVFDRIPVREHGARRDGWLHLCAVGLGHVRLERWLENLRPPVGQ
jgi:hypothetical protein